MEGYMLLQSNKLKLHYRSGSRGLPRFIKGTYWATGLFLTTPFTEGCAGANKKASPPGRHQEQASKQRCTFSLTTFSSVQFYPAQWDGLSSGLTVAVFSHAPMHR